MDRTRIGSFISRRVLIARRVRLTVAAAVPAILSVALAAPAYQARAAVASRHGAPAPHASAAAAALKRAKAIGRPVVVAPDTTTTSQTVANPDGTFTNTINALPVRVRQHGAWAPLNARLVRGHGFFRPVAAEEPLTLSTGGAGPLAVMHGPHRQNLSLWFPASLRRPVVSGATATYRSVRPGIDLRLTATAMGGITQTLVVRTAAAAASPWLRRFTERYATTGGLKLRADAAGNLVAAGRSGPVFGAAPPTVILPARRSAHQRASAPGLPTAVGRATVSADHITDLVTGRSLARPAAFPLTVTVAIAPVTRFGTGMKVTGVMNPDAFPSPNTIKTPGYVEAQDVAGTGGCQDVKNWDSTSVTKLGVGFQAWDTCIGIYQSYYVFDTAGISTSWDILHSELNATEVNGSWDACTGVAKEPIYLHSLGASAGIGSGTEGSNVAKLGTASGAFAISVLPAANPNSGDNCADQPADFDVTSVAASIQANHKSWTFGLNGDDTDSTTTGQFMRLSDTPTLVTTFDQTPPAPTMQQSTPSMVDNPGAADTHLGCKGSSSEIPWIGATSSVKLNATFTAALSGEEVEPVWHVWNATTTVVNKTNANIAAGSFPFSFTSPTNGDEYFSQISTTVNGNGGQGGLDKGLTTTGPECSFADDAAPPTVPVVTTPDFPPSGSSPGTTQVAPGASGTFSFSSADPAPSGCASGNPIAAAGYATGAATTCLASGVYEFEYSLNTPLASGSVTAPVTTCPSGGVSSGAVAAVNPTGNPTTSSSANPSATTTATSCQIDVNQWGTNILYVAAVDTAGNISQSFQYEFYVPFNSATTVQAGDIDGDGKPDLLAKDSSGNLVFFPGGSDPANGPTTASLAGDAPEFATFGDDWSHFDVTHRDSFSGGNVDDLLALDTSTGNLYRYNNGFAATGGIGMFENSANVVNEFYPGCSPIPAGEGGAGSSNCTNYPTTGWSGFTQVIAPGDAWLGAPTTPASITDDSKQPSLLGVAGNGTLWLFQGSGGQLTSPVQIGSGGWNDVTVMAAGIVDGTDTIWARVNIGTDAGDVLSFGLTVPSGQVPTLNASSPGTLPAATGGTILVNSSGATISVPTANFPTVTAIGPLSADACVSTSNDTSGCPGFFAQDTSGNVFFYPGQPTTTAASALTGTHELVGNMNNIG